MFLLCPDFPSPCSDRPIDAIQTINLGPFETFSLCELSVYLTTLCWQARRLRVAGVFVVALLSDFLFSNTSAVKSKQAFTLRCPTKTLFPGPTRANQLPAAFGRLASTVMRWSWQGHAITSLAARESQCFSKFLIIALL